MTIEEAVRITQAMSAREFYDACLVVIPYNIGPAGLTPNGDGRPPKGNR
jgi:hypothetical protein